MFSKTINSSIYSIISKQLKNEKSTKSNTTTPTKKQEYFKNREKLKKLLKYINFFWNKKKEKDIKK